VTTRLAIASTVAAVSAGLGVEAVDATTAPGTLYVSKLVIRDDAISVRVRRHRWSSTLHYLRGAEVRYEVTNHGTHPFGLNILGSTTGMLAPGRSASILVYWGNRGKYVFRAVPRGARLRVVVS
jgi:hypothetical protein